MDDRWPIVQIALVVLGCIISIITIIANLANFLVVVFRRVQKSSHNMLLGSLSAADLITGLLGMPLAIAHLIGTLNDRDNLCFWWLFTVKLSHSASILTLCAIAIDRLWAVKDPLVYETLNRSPKLIGVIWCVSILFGFLPVLKFQETSGNECYVQQGPYHLFMLILFVVFPLFFIILCYIFVYKEVRNSEEDLCKSVEKTVECHVSSVNTNEPVSVVIVDSDHSKNASLDKYRSETNLTGNNHTVPRDRQQVSISTRILVISLIITGVFIGCTIPISSLVIVGQIYPESLDNWYYSFKILEWVKMLNSFFNPFIYTIFNAEFRNVYKKMCFGSYQRIFKSN